MSRATIDDAAEVLVLQRCCWVDEALANETLDVPAFRESLDEVADWIYSWSTWCVRRAGRLIAAVRARQDAVIVPSQEAFLVECAQPSDKLRAACRCKSGPRRRPSPW